MLIIGAKGFAKEVLEILNRLNRITDLVFYDDVNKDTPDVLFERFPVLKSADQAKYYFENINNNFTIGIGDPKLRRKLADKFEALGGQLVSTICNSAQIGCYGNKIEQGCNIMTGVIITSDVKIKKGSLINLNSTIGHDCQIGEFVEISPGVNISGNCKIGDYTNIGTNAVILPKVIVGNNVIIGAGAVVTNDLPDNVIAVGVPAKIIKYLD